MNHVRIMQNGDPENGSPHWQVIVWEDGGIRGEILTKGSSRRLPKDFKLDYLQEFFAIPTELTNKKLAAVPPREEVIISINVLSGTFGSSLLSDIPKNSVLQKAVEEIVGKITALVGKSIES